MYSYIKEDLINESEENIDEKILILGSLVGVIVLVFAVSFITIFGHERENDIIEKEDLKSLEVELDSGAGRVNLSRDAEEGVNGTAQYNVRMLKPIVENKEKEIKG